MARKAATPITYPDFDNPPDQIPLSRFQLAWGMGSREDTEFCLHNHERGKTDEWIASKMGRTPKEVWSRIKTIICPKCKTFMCPHGRDKKLRAAMRKAEAKMPKADGKHWTTKQIEYITKRASEGAAPEYIADEMRKNGIRPGCTTKTVVRLMWKLKIKRVRLHFHPKHAKVSRPKAVELPVAKPKASTYVVRSGRASIECSSVDDAVALADRLR